MKDFSWWSGLTIADAKAGLGLLGSEFIHEVIDGQTYWFSASQSEAKNLQSTAHLIPVLDEYIVAYRDPGLIYDAAFAEQGKHRNFVSTIAMNGRIIGEWKPVFKKDAVEITAHPFTKFTSVQNRALDAAAYRFSEFLGLPVILKISPSKPA